MILARNFEHLGGLVGLSKMPLLFEPRCKHKDTHESLQLSKDSLFGLFDIFLTTSDLEDNS